MTDFALPGQDQVFHDTTLSATPELRKPTEEVSENSSSVKKAIDAIEPDENKFALVRRRLEEDGQKLSEAEYCDKHNFATIMKRELEPEPCGSTEALEAIHAFYDID